MLPVFPKTETAKGWRLLEPLRVIGLLGMAIDNLSIGACGAGDARVNPRLCCPAVR